MKKFTIYYLCLAMLVIGFACKEDMPEEKSATEVEALEYTSVSFQVAGNENQKTAATYNPASIMITLTDDQGVVIVEKKVIDLISINGSFVSKPLILPQGNYNLTEFLVLDDDNNAVLAAPIDGAANDHLTDTPLPLAFIINGEENITLLPSVVPTENLDASTLGYISWQFDVKEPIEFTVTVFTFDEQTGLPVPATANLSVNSDGAEVVNIDLDASSNTILVQDNSLDHNLIITKEGYTSHSESILYADLSGQNVSVVLEKEALVTDVDGNEYPVVTIGNQTWMAANLKTTKYADGQVIGDMRTNSYGGYYSYQAATRGVAHTNANPSSIQGACPTDWHVPSASEFVELENAVGGRAIAAGNLKSLSMNWTSPNTGATDEFGFAAEPNGYYNYGRFSLNGGYAFYLTTTEYPDVDPGFRIFWMQYDSGASRIVWDREYHQWAVRCVKD